MTVTALPAFVVPSETPPQIGDTFKVRLHPGEYTIEQIEEAAYGDRDLMLDIFNPADPAVCYVQGDHDRWVLGSLEPLVRHNQWYIFDAIWKNQAFEGPTRLRVLIDTVDKTVHVKFN